MLTMNTSLTAASRVQPWQRSVHIPGADSFPPGITHDTAWAKSYHRTEFDDLAVSRAGYYGHAAGVVVPHEAFVLTAQLPPPPSPGQAPPCYYPPLIDGHAVAGQYGPPAKRPGLGVGGWVGMGQVTTMHGQQQRVDDTGGGEWVDHRGQSSMYDQTRWSHPKTPSLPGLCIPRTATTFRTEERTGCSFQPPPPTTSFPSITDTSFNSHSSARGATITSTNNQTTRPCRPPYEETTTHLPMVECHTHPLMSKTPPQRCGVYAPTQLQQVVHSTPHGVVTRYKIEYRGPDLDTIPDSVPIPPVTQQARVTVITPQRTSPLTHYTTTTIAAHSTTRLPDVVGSAHMSRPTPSSSLRDVHYDRRLLKTSYQTDFGGDGEPASSTHFAAVTFNRGLSRGRYQAGKADRSHAVPCWAMGPSKGATLRTGADHLATFANGIAPVFNFSNRLHS